MSGDFASGKRAHGFCDRCGFRANLREMRKLVINDHVTNLKVCESCWEPDHPQYHINRVDTRDPQALREARPDISMNSSRMLYVHLQGTVVTLSPGRIV